MSGSLDGRLVVVADDEDRIIQFVRVHFEMEGARVMAASGGEQALQLIREHLPDIVILDVMMPGLDGLETLRRIRAFSEVPVIMLTVQANEPDRIRALDLGADDYMAKPFSPAELVSRTRAVLRRTQTPTETRLVRVDDDLSIDFGAREAIVRGNRVKLRPTEWRLLYHLVQNAGWLLTHEMILAKVWGPEYVGDLQYLRVWISRIRAKIGRDDSDHSIVRTFPGIGYMLSTQPGPAQGTDDGSADEELEAEDLVSEVRASPDAQPA